MIAQNSPERLKAAQLISDLENIRAYLKTQVEAGKITDEEQKAQDTYISSAQELLSTHAKAFSGQPDHEIGYLNFIIQTWRNQLFQYSERPNILYNMTRKEAYSAYAELILLELEWAVAIANKQVTLSAKYVEFEEKQYLIRVYTQLDSPWQVVEYVSEDIESMVSRVYVHGEGYCTPDIYQRVLNAAFVSGPAIAILAQQKMKAIEFPVIKYYRHFLVADAETAWPGNPLQKRSTRYKTTMAFDHLDLVITTQRFFAEYGHTVEAWVKHLVHEVGHEVEVRYNVHHLIPNWFVEGTKNMQAWSGDYHNQGFLFALIRGEKIENLNKKKFDGGPDYPHAALFCDYVDEVSGGKLAKGWVEIERRVDQENETFEQAFEEVIDQTSESLMNQFYAQLLPLAIQSVDRVVELEYEREAIQKTTGVDVSKMSVDEIRNVLREALRGKIITAPSRSLRDTATSI